MAVTYVTLYPPGGNSTQVQVVEGSQLHLIYAAMGFSAIPSAPGPAVRPDPFPQYVHDDEIGDLLADAAIPATDPVVAALVTNTGSATSGALGAAFVPGGDLRAFGIHRPENYGTVGDGDDTAPINDAITAAATTGGQVLLTAAEYIADGITLRHLVTVRGTGMKRTRLKPKAGGTATGLILLNQGFAQQAFLEDVELVGNGNAGQHAVHLVATPIAPFNNGGWWQSGLRRVDISGFNGDCIYLKGGGGVGYDNLLPHQFLLLEQVYAFAQTGRHALRTEGQVGQVDYISCQFDGPGVSAADDVPNVLIQEGAYLHNFRGCTFQSRKNAVIVDAGNVVNFQGCYWESTGFAITARNFGSVSVSDSHFANAALMGDGTGRLFQALTHGSIHVSGALHVIGTVEGGASADGDSLINGSTATQQSVGFTQAGSTRQIAVAGDGSIALLTSVSTYLVNSSATPIAWISGPSWFTGQTVHLRAHDGPITLASGGHIDLGGRASPVTVPSGGIVTLVKFDLGPNWAVASISA